APAHHFPLPTRHSPLPRFYYLYPNKSFDLQILWSYLKPHRWLIVLSLVLAGLAQLLTLIDPIIFGKIIDEYATLPNDKTQDELVSGVLFWLGVAVAIALLARLAKTFQEYVM